MAIWLPRLHSIPFLTLFYLEFIARVIELFHQTDDRARFREFRLLLISTFSTIRRAQFGLYFGNKTQPSVVEVQKSTTNIPDFLRVIST